MTVADSPTLLQEIERFVATIGDEIAAAASIGLAVVGDRLGLYRALAASGPATSSELAARTGCNERYVREWLGNQTASGWIAFDPELQRFSLPPAHAAVLADEESPVFLGGSVQVVAALFAGLDGLAEAFRTGAGIAWGDQHGDLHDGAARFFRTACQAALVPWIEDLDGIADRLRAGGAVADVGCGRGMAALHVAAAFPGATVTGCDSHAASIEQAQRAATAAGLADRVTFAVADATAAPAARFDLVMMLDCLHDMGDPVAAARQALTSLTPDGALLVVEPAAADRLQDGINPIARMYYATSTAFCTPCALAQDGGWALGNQAGASRLRNVLEQAGAHTVRVVAETPYQHVYEVR